MTCIIYDVIIPTGKDLLHDIVTKGMDRLIYGNDAPTRGARPSRLNSQAMVNTTAIVNHRSVDFANLLNVNAILMSQ